MGPLHVHNIRSVLHEDNTGFQHTKGTILNTLLRISVQTLQSLLITTIITERIHERSSVLVQLPILRRVLLCRRLHYSSQPNESD